MRSLYLTHKFPDLFLGVVLTEIAVLCVYVAFATNETAPFLFRWLMLHGAFFFSFTAYAILFTMSGSREREEAARARKARELSNG